MDRLEAERPRRDLFFLSDHFIHLGTCRMSLPPAKWSAMATVRHAMAAKVQTPVRNLVLATAWAQRNPGARERYRAALAESKAIVHSVCTEDGWQCTLLQHAAPCGATAEPVMLVPGLGWNEKTLHAQNDRSIVRFLQQNGHDVFVLAHRSSAFAVPPAHRQGFNFDDIVHHDVPAALERIKTLSSAKRVHWIGHGFGGQLLIGHLANDGGCDIASGTLIGTATRFQPLRATARRAAVVAKWLPSHWRIPLQQVQEVLMAASRPSHLVPVTRRIEGPIARGLMSEGIEDLAVGVLQQVAKWHEVGSLVSFDNRFDYSAAMCGKRVPIFTIAATNDPLCQPADAHAIIDSIAKGFGKRLTLPAGWAHLDPVAGADAARVVFPQIGAWTKQHNERCW